LTGLQRRGDDVILVVVPVSGHEEAEREPAQIVGGGPGEPTHGRIRRLPGHDCGETLLGKQGTRRGRDGGFADAGRAVDRGQETRSSRDGLKIGPD
jgi:hypothetical protein